VLLLESSVASATTEELAEALIGEYVHLASGHADGTITFEKALVKAVVRLVYRRQSKD
jgi:hypothetical protein